MVKTIVVNLNEIWDKKILRKSKMRTVIEIIKDIKGYEGSWLVHMINEERMMQDDNIDEAFMNKYGKCNKRDLYYYFPLLNCHVYSLFLGVF